MSFLMYTAILAFKKKGLLGQSALLSSASVVFYLRK